MKILKIENSKGFYLNTKDKTWLPIDQIDKDGLMGLLDEYLKADVEMDVFDESLLANQAQQIVYKSIFDKFALLNDNKSKFKDESQTQYLAEIKRYQSIGSTTPTA